MHDKFVRCEGKSFGEFKPFISAYPDSKDKDRRRLVECLSSTEKSKVVKDIERAVELSGLKNGKTISFHHHFRNGDRVVNTVIDTLAQMGFKDLTVAASSLSDVHAPMIEHIKNGVVTNIQTSGMRGPLANAISEGLMDNPVVFRSHGGRGAAIKAGSLHIDVAFLAAPSCDPLGNANGYLRDGDSSSECGSMGYAKVDAEFAGRVIILTDHIADFPNAPFGIPQSQVDYIVKIDEIGDKQEIMSGATRFTTNPKDLLIAQNAAEVIAASGYFENGFSLQTGTGGASLAAIRFLRDKMISKGVKASFALGGITGQMVKMHEEGLIKKLLDVQSFDLLAVDSLKNNRFHQQIDAIYYASPHKQGAAVNQLDVTVLSALEIDVDFNVNVLTGSNAVIRGAIGGHQDSAAGASCTIVVAPLMRGRMTTVLDRVTTLVTPGETVDVLVTEQGIAVNPRREDLMERLIAAGLPVTSITALKKRAEKIVGKPESVKYDDKIVGVVTYRDGTVIDTVRQIQKHN